MMAALPLKLHLGSQLEWRSPNDGKLGAGTADIDGSHMFSPGTAPGKTSTQAGGKGTGIIPQRQKPQSAVA